MKDVRLLQLDNGHAVLYYLEDALDIYKLLCVINKKVGAYSYSGSPNLYSRVFSCGNESRDKFMIVGEVDSQYTEKEKIGVNKYSVSDLDDYMSGLKEQGYQVFETEKGLYAISLEEYLPDDRVPILKDLFGTIRDNEKRLGKIVNGKDAEDDVRYSEYKIYEELDNELFSILQKFTDYSKDINLDMSSGYYHLQWKPDIVNTKFCLVLSPCPSFDDGWEVYHRDGTNVNLF